MKKKKKAFTLLELIITLAITVMVLGVIYTFFLSNTKTLVTTEVNTDLQNESQNIQDAILKYGTEAKGIFSINGTEVKSDNMLYKDILNSTGKMEVKEIVFEFEIDKSQSQSKGDKYKFEFDKDNKTLYLTKNNEVNKILSTNIKEFQIRPLDYRMKFDEASNENKGKLYEANGIEVSYVLNIKKGYSNVSIPGSIIVKFRNKQ